MSMNHNKKLPHITVLVSGNGSNLQALIDACRDGTLAARIGLVVASRPDAFGLDRARQAHIPTATLHWKQYRAAGKSRREYDRDLAAVVEASCPALIVLAGWMRVLTNTFLSRFPHKVINLHPALPGMFPGLHAIERAFQAFQNNTIQETGVMVHWVPDEGVDTGPVIRTGAVPIHVQDTLECLTRRVHEAEHTLLVNAVAETLVRDVHS